MGADFVIMNPFGVIMKIITLVGLSAVMLLSACQSTPTTPILKRADQSFETTGLGKTKAAAKQNALNAAQKQCKTRTPTVLTDSATYNGVLDEKTGRMIEQGVGVIGAILGTKTPNLARDDDHEYTIRFVCQ